MRRALAALVAGIAIGVALNPLTGKSRPPKWWLQGALCVHRGEGAWDANTGNGYYGGMQMDYTFARKYGGWTLRHHGLPHRWRPATQLFIAYRGWKRQGWFAWPNTARNCGLI